MWGVVCDMFKMVNEPYTQRRILPRSTEFYTAGPNFYTAGETIPMTDGKAQFHIGQIVHHVLFDYRGAIFDVDQQFAQDDTWYDTMARSRPPKDKPWYQVLVDGATHTTYVAERNLEPDDSGQPIDHPLVQ